MIQSRNFETLSNFFEPNFIKFFVKIYDFQYVFNVKPKFGDYLIIL